MSLHQIEHRPCIDARTRNPRSLTRDLRAAFADADAARADVRRLSRGRALDDPRTARAVARALAQLRQAEADVDRLTAAIHTAGGHITHDHGHQVVVADRRGRTIAILPARKAGPHQR